MKEFNAVVLVGNVREGFTPQGVRYSDGMVEGAQEGVPFDAQGKPAPLAQRPEGLLGGGSFG